MPNFPPSRWFSRNPGHPWSPESPAICPSPVAAAVRPARFPALAFARGLDLLFPLPRGFDSVVLLRSAIRLSSCFSSGRSVEFNYTVPAGVLSERFEEVGFFFWFGLGGGRILVCVRSVVWGFEVRVRGFFESITRCRGVRDTSRASTARGTRGIIPTRRMTRA